MRGAGGGVGAFSSPSSIGFSVSALDLAPPRSSEDFGRCLDRHCGAFKAELNDSNNNDNNNNNNNNNNNHHHHHNNHNNNNNNNNNKNNNNNNNNSTNRDNNEFIYNNKNNDNNDNDTSIAAFLIYTEIFFLMYSCNLNKFLCSFCKDAQTMTLHHSLIIINRL